MNAVTLMRIEFPSRIFTITLALFALLAIGCAHQLPIGNLSGRSDDLQAIVDEGLQLAQRLGPSRVLVVFDLDNTLFAMEQGLGSDQWYEWQKAAAALDPCDARVVADRFAVQGALYFASAMRPTQPDAAMQLRRLQDAGVPVIALTSRGVVYRLQTFRELRRNGFDFRRSAIGPEGGWPDTFTPDRGTRPARYEEGVFLTSGQHKGRMLEELLERTAAPLPRVLVVIDDKRSNLDQYRETFFALGVPVHSWRYTREDGNVAAFDPDASHALWLTLRPALETLQDQLGPDNYALPPATVRPGCP